jgi:hypothetical protein
MAKSARVEVLDEAKFKLNNETLCFQKCIYHYSDRKDEPGFRFIWRDSVGHLRPQRGQAIIYNYSMLSTLINRAKKKGWF